MGKKLTVTDMLKKSNKELNREINTLKNTIRSQQDIIEETRSQYHDIDKQHAVLQSKNNFSIIYEIIRFILTIGIGIISNMLNNGNWYYVLLLIILAIIYIWTLSYQSYQFWSK